MFEKFAVSTLPFGPFAVVFGAAMLSVAHGAVTGNLRKKAKVEYPNAVRYTKRASQCRQY